MATHPQPHTVPQLVINPARATVGPYRGTADASPSLPEMSFPPMPSLNLSSPFPHRETHELLPHLAPHDGLILTSSRHGHGAVTICRPGAVCPWRSGAYQEDELDGGRARRCPGVWRAEGRGPGEGAGRSALALRGSRAEGG